jgi:hypothetical protein
VAFDGDQNHSYTNIGSSDAVGFSVITLAPIYRSLLFSFIFFLSTNLSASNCGPLKGRYLCKSQEEAFDYEMEMIIHQKQLYESRDPDGKQVEFMELIFPEHQEGDSLLVDGEVHFYKDAYYKASCLKEPENFSISWLSFEEKKEFKSVSIERLRNNLEVIVTHRDSNLGDWDLLWMCSPKKSSSN